MPGPVVGRWFLSGFGVGARSSPHPRGVGSGAQPGQDGCESIDLTGELIEDRLASQGGVLDDRLHVVAGTVDQGDCLGRQGGDVFAHAQCFGDGLGFLGGAPGVGYEDIGCHRSHLNFLL